MKYTLSLFVLFWIACTPTKRTSVTQKADSVQQIVSDYESYDQQADKDQLWPDFSEARQAKELSHYVSLQKRMLALPESGLTAVEQINRDILLLLLDDRIFNIDFNSHWFPLNAEGGFLAGVVYNIRSVRVRSEVDYQKYLKKLRALPTYFNSRQAHLEQGKIAGKMVPKLIVNNCITLIDHLLNTPVEETFFVAVVADQAMNKKEVSNLVSDDIFPAYQQLRKFLQEDYLPEAPTKVGIANIKDGKAYYEQRVRYFTTDDIRPEKVFEIGQAEVKRIRAQMEDIIAQLKFGGSFEAFLHFLRTDPQFYPKSGTELLQRAAWITKRIEGQLPHYFGKLPRMPLTVKPVPDALAPTYTTGRYSPGSYKNQKAGEYWVNTYKLESRPYYVLPALSLHEGVPGHHLQIMLAAENEAIAGFRQSFYISAFGEGWGLYAEYLGKEAGIYENLYEEFGALTYEMWRACRLVVDPGMHYMGWTRAEAMQFMLDNTALSEHEVTTEIDRYIGWPGQAVSYKIGELKIRELRKRAEKALGDRFDIRSFHDTILENGSVPLFTLERIVDDYIKAQIKMEKK